MCQVTLAENESAKLAHIAETHYGLNGYTHWRPRWERTVAGRAKVLHWPYRPRLSTLLPGASLFHSGGSALAWVRIVIDGEATTSVDVELTANSRLLMEQREQESA